MHSETSTILATTTFTRLPLTLGSLLQPCLLATVTTRGPSPQFSRRKPAKNHDTVWRIALTRWRQEPAHRLLASMSTAKYCPACHAFDSFERNDYAVACSTCGFVDEAQTSTINYISTYDGYTVHDANFKGFSNSDPKVRERAVRERLHEVSSINAQRADVSGASSCQGR
jgi:hypothetical protein